ncbi:hypothetical protein HY025_03660 [Candidatus Daviesbacteria bacterium]|nr:hypothetical protein [Candidatus Daviesbacteria bacterium]
MRRSFEFLPFHRPIVPIEERLVRSLNPAKELPRTPKGRLIIHQLIQRRGLYPGEYQLFFVSGEGIFLTKDNHDPIEVTSGYVVTRDLKYFNFLMDRNQKTHRITFTEWEEVSFEPQWEDSTEYKRALANLK